MAEVESVPVSEPCAGIGLDIATIKESKRLNSKVDGSQLSWRNFRRDVLAPHRIRILESATKRLPERLVTMFDAQNKNTSKYETQMSDFRDQVAKGRGFGPSPLFPPNLLPPIEGFHHVARCMVPAFSREAQPDRALNQLGPLYELNPPRPGLGCGFSTAAFVRDEILTMPSYAITSGTIVHFETGYISPGAMLYCPFLTFERTMGIDEENLERANNQCAVSGAWCCRAIQMLYAKAWKANERGPELPVTFSCAINNDYAVLNYHWIDHAQAYCMSPICKFDLTKEDHFGTFQAWIEVIGKWALQTLLPNIKEALERIRTAEPDSATTASPMTPRALPTLTLTTTELNRDELLIKSLKGTFDNVPWRFDDEEFTPVSSSTASWGSPMVTDAIYQHLTYPSVPSLRTKPRRSALTKSVPHSAHPSIGMSTPPPSYSVNTELVLQKRLAHAMDEIKDLHNQFEALKADVTGSKTVMQEEMTGLKTTVDSVLRKEMLRVEESQPSPLAPSSMIETWQATTVNVRPAPRSPLAKWYTMLTKGEAAASPLIQEVRFTPSPLKPSTSGSTLSPIQEGETPHDTETPPSPTDTDTNTIRTTTLTTLGAPSPRMLRSAKWPDTPGLKSSFSTHFPITPGFPSPAFSIMSSGENVVIVPPPPAPGAEVLLTPGSLLKWAVLLFTGQVAGAFIPYTPVRILALGLLTDVCLMAVAGKGLYDVPSMWASWRMSFAR